MAKAPAKAVEEETPAATEQQENPAKKKWILLATIVVVLLSVSVGGTFAVIGMMGADEDAKAEAADGAAAQPAKAPIIYLPLEPAFLTNFVVSGRPRYLQVSLALTSRDPAVMDAVQKHMPLIRNRIVMLLSAEQFEMLRVRAGREALQVKLQDAVKEVLQKESVKGDIDKVLFTHFVMQ